MHQLYIPHSYEYEHILLLAMYFCTHISENIIHTVYFTTCSEVNGKSALKWEY
jgi:hypothetical protein